MCKEANALLLTEVPSRTKVPDQAFQFLNVSMDKVLPATCSTDVIADFWALGWSWLQVQMMTRLLRHSSNIDKDDFSARLVTAANIATSSSSTPQQIRESLQSCFDLLLEEKNRYYPVAVDLVDFTLLAQTTLGKSLTRQLHRSHSTNLLLTGDLAHHIESEKQELAELIRSGVSSNQIGLCGGLHVESRDSLLSLNAVIDNLRRGADVIESVFGTRPRVFARRSGGLTTSLPGVLERSGFPYAIHSTLDDARFPQSNSFVFRWESPSGDSALALGQVPVDASAAETFLVMSMKIGELIDSQHGACVLLAHWPGGCSEFFEDMRRAHEFGPLLGKFVLVDEFFDGTYDPGYGERFRADDYRSNELQGLQRVDAADPISSYIRYWNSLWRLASLEFLLTLAAFMRPTGFRTLVSHFEPIRKMLALDPTPALNIATESSLDVVENRLLEIFGANTTGSHPDEARSLLLFNPASFTRPVHVRCDTPKRNTDSPFRSKMLTGDSNANGTDVVVTLPGTGFCSLGAAMNAATPAKPDSWPDLVAGNLLRNEHFEVRIDEATGGVRGVRLYDRRLNLLTQKLSLRRFAGHAAVNKATYAAMVADQVELVAESKISARAISNGALMIDNRKVAAFRQVVSITRGRPFVDFEIEFELPRALTGGAWGNYVCNRIAWQDDATRIEREQHGSLHEVTAQRFTAPNLVRLRSADHEICWLPGGAPFHQRTGPRTMDTLLIVPGETGAGATVQKFRMALCVNPPNSIRACRDWNCRPFLIPDTSIPCRARQKSGRPDESIPTGANDEPMPRIDEDGDHAQARWLFHFNNRNIMTTMLQPNFDLSDRCSGVRVRLQETAGRRGELTIRCPRTVMAAAIVDLAGNAIEDLSTDEDRVHMGFLGHQVLDVVIEW